MILFQILYPLPRPHGPFPSPSPPHCSLKFGTPLLLGPSFHTAHVARTIILQPHTNQTTNLKPQTSDLDLPHVLPRPQQLPATCHPSVSVSESVSKSVCVSVSMSISVSVCAHVNRAALRMACGKQSGI